METRILESSINKICSLLAVGFGDAGAEVLICSFCFWAIHAFYKFPSTAIGSRMPWLS